MSLLGTVARQRATINGFAVACLVLITVLSFLIAFPVTRLILWTFFPDGDFDVKRIYDLFTAPWLPRVVGATAILAFVSATLSVAVGAILAWLNERTDANFGQLSYILPIIPLLIPNIALSIGWVFIAAPDVGFLNAWMVKHLGVQVNIYSWTGLIFVYTLNGVPYAYLIVSAALRNLDSFLEEASQISGATPIKTLLAISIPTIKPAIVASLLVIAIINLSVYSIPAIIATTARIDLLPTRIVTMAAKEYPPQIVEAQLLGVVMMIMITIIWIVQNRISANRNFVTLGGKSATITRLPLGRWKWPARSIMAAFIATSCFLPALALVLVSFQPYWTPAVDFSVLGLHNYRNVLFVNTATSSALRNSLFLSVAGATIGIVAVTTITLYLTQREGPVARSVDFIVKIPAVVPHLVMALAFLLAFSGPPFSLGGSVLILLLAYIVIYIPPGAIAAGAAVLQVGKDLYEASAISGATEARTARRIIVPLALPGILGGWAIVFVHMMGDVSGAAILAGIGNPVIGFSILEIWETGSFGGLAALSVILCAVNIIVMTMISTIGSRYSRR